MDNININNKIEEALIQINNDNYESAKQIVFSILNNTNISLNNDQWTSIGNILLSCGLFTEAKNAFIKADNLCLVAYSLILTESLDEAEKLIRNLNKNPVSQWCIFLVDIFKNHFVTRWPSFMEIRNFMELTVYYLLLGNKNNLIDKLKKKLNKLTSINIDSEKYIGYAYMHYGDYDTAIVTINTHLKKNGDDGEAYFYLGQIYFLKNDLTTAKKVLEKANKLLLSHSPTRDLLEKIKKKA